MWAKSLIIGGCLLAICSQAKADDVILTIPDQATVTYDPFTGLPGLRDIAFELTNSGGTALSAHLVVTPDFGGGFEMMGLSDPLSFELSSSQGAMQADQFIMPIGLPAESGAQQFDLTVIVPAGQYADAGESGLDLRLSLVDPQTQELLMPERIISVASLVPSRAQTNFAGATPGFENGTSFSTVEFGAIEPGKMRQVNFQIRGNTDVTVEVSSLNNGKLVHDTNPDTSFVPYTVDADGVVSDLSGPMTLQRTPEKSLSGTSYPMTITLDEGPVTQFAGQYTDIITIDVYPN